jgi:hypothetical protein
MSSAAEKRSNGTGHGSGITVVVMLLATKLSNLALRLAQGLQLNA